MHVVNVRRFFLLWTSFIVFGCLTTKFLNLPQIEGWFRLIGDGGFGLGISLLALRWIVYAEGYKKIFLILFAISFFSEFILCSIYDIRANIFFKPSPFFRFFFVIPDFFVWSLQMVGLYLISADTKMHSKNLKNKIPLSFILPALFIILIILFCISWRIDFSNPSGIFIMMTAILEAFGFALISSYLIRIRNQAILFILLGFSICISADYSMIVNIVESVPNINSFFQIVSIVGLAFILYGFTKFNPQHLKIKSEAWFYKNNSIQSKVALWNFILCMFLTIIFTSLISFILWPHHAMYDTIKYLPAIIIFLTTLTTLISIQFSKRLLSPLKAIQETIDKFSTVSTFKPDPSNKDHGIFEYIQLNKFLNKSFSLVEEKLNAEKKVSEMALEVAHDIRSPVSAIEMIVSTISHQISEAHRNVLNQATQSVRNTANDLLTRYRSSDDKVNKVDLQNGESCEERLLLSSVVELVVTQKRYEWPLDSYQLTISISPDAASTWISVIPNDLKKMLSNLLNNAYESLKNNREIQISLTYTENNLELIIKDKGIGVPNDLIEDILTGTSLKHYGKGLGLSGAKKYMESIGGKLIFSSIEASGSKVSLIFPIIKMRDK